jgi:hypothetical protein
MINLAIQIYLIQFSMYFKTIITMLVEVFFNGAYNLFRMHILKHL